MLKHPVLLSMGIAAAICAGFVAYMLAGTRNVDEKPFIAYFGLLGFPFLWFIVWVVVNAVAWWTGMKSGSSKEG